MRRSTALRLTAAAAALSLSPMLGACSVTLGHISHPSETGVATSRPTEAPRGTSNATPPATTATERPTQDQSTQSSESPSDVPAEPQASATDTTTGSASEATTTTPATGGRSQVIEVPADSGISHLELIDLYGGGTSTDAFGKGVGIFRITNDRPMLLNLRIRIFDAAGKEIGRNEGLNANLTTGEHDLVTSNLIKLPEGARPKSFKVTFIDKTDVSSGPVFSSVDKPVVGTSSKVEGVPVLKGTARFTGPMSGTVDAAGACILPNGTIYAEHESLLDNQTRPDGQGSAVDYEIPLYDAQGVDLSEATCYASV